ncbi:uncharacterized protein [Medicago truncatula]|uniref:uncharacterized protein isoform X2 n=1 Tax=Medicago truncatula TaxID=3880 RepID=UPI000D2F4379|nr:uncharacterized protein LOC25490457 isoform X2 [Medicago truncatula]
MERKEKPKMSVPQFGGWENKSKGVPTDYSMVFNIARENKKNHKTDWSEVKRRLSISNERVATNATNHRHGHGHGHGFGHNHHHHSHADSPVMGRSNALSYMNCCLRP